jgi:hypothetical protein
VNRLQTYRGVFAPFFGTQQGADTLNQLKGFDFMHERGELPDAIDLAVYLTQNR